MSDGVSIELDDQAFERAVQRVRGRVLDMRTVWRGVGRYLKSKVQLTFRAQQSPYGVAWAPTQRGGHILKDTGRLEGSITAEAGEHFAAVGTNTVYAPVHQFGATIRAKVAPFLSFKIGDRWVNRKEVTIPARPFLPTEGLPEDWQQGVLNVLERHFQRA